MPTTTPTTTTTTIINTKELKHPVTKVNPEAEEGIKEKVAAQAEVETDLGAHVLF